MVVSRFAGKTTALQPMVDALAGERIAEPAGVPHQVHRSLGYRDSVAAVGKAMGLERCQGIGLHLEALGRDVGRELLSQGLAPAQGIQADVPVIVLGEHPAIAAINGPDVEARRDSTGSVA